MDRKGGQKNPHALFRLIDANACPRTMSLGFFEITRAEQLSFFFLDFRQ